MNPFWHLLDALCALLCAVFSGMGLGGGSLLLIYLTELRNIPQAEAQAIGLLLFIASGMGCIPIYLRKGVLKDKKTALRFLPGGIVFALIGAGLGTYLPGGLLRKLFGGFLLFVGARGIWRKVKARKEG